MNKSKGRFLYIHAPTALKHTPQGYPQGIKVPRSMFVG